jgi:hypothetical protein
MKELPHPQTSRFQRNEMRASATSRLQCRYTPRYRSILPTLLVLLCIPIFFYHLIPKYTSATDSIISSLVHTLHPSSQPTSTFCTKEIGSPRCCALYLEAAPCVEECRKQHMDRQTFAVTKEYDECAEVCLVKYTGICKGKTEEKDEPQTQTQTRVHGSRTTEYWSSMIQHKSRDD